MSNIINAEVIKKAAEEVKATRQRVALEHMFKQLEDGLQKLLEHAKTTGKIDATFTITLSNEFRDVFERGLIVPEELADKMKEAGLVWELNPKDYHEILVSID